MPQGGVLSPTLFSVYVNDIPLAEKDKETSLLFADDIVYLLKFKFRAKGRLIESA